MYYSRLVRKQKSRLKPFQSSSFPPTAAPHIAVDVQICKTGLLRHSFPFPFLCVAVSHLLYIRNVFDGLYVLLLLAFYGLRTPLSLGASCRSWKLLLILCSDVIGYLYPSISFVHGFTECCIF